MLRSTVKRRSQTRSRFLRSVLSTVCGLTLAAAAIAQSHNFDIPGGELKAALDAYARQSGVRLIYLSDEVSGISSRGVSGQMSYDAALEQLLDGTGFLVRRDKSGAVAVVRRSRTDSQEAHKSDRPSNDSTAPTSEQDSDVSAPSGSEEPAGATAGRGTFGSATPANATIETVQVTGSHIRGTELSGVGPVTVIDAEAIASSGAVSVETLLQRMPAAAGAAGSQSNNFWTGSGNGATQINLRGLGVNRTLVLLNGRRVVNGGTGANNSVDLNIVPVALIERIEVLKDGASAIYGADAVAGVVNIITKQELNGIEASTRYGRTFEDDGEILAANLTWGKSTEDTALMGSINYSESGTVTMASRAPLSARGRGWQAGMRRQLFHDRRSGAVGRWSYDQLQSRPGGGSVVVRNLFTCEAQLQLQLYPQRGEPHPAPRDERVRQDRIDRGCEPVHGDDVHASRVATARLAEHPRPIPHDPHSSHSSNEPYWTKLGAGAAPDRGGWSAPNHNLQLRYAPTRSLDVSVGVENLFDKKAPFIQNNPNANTDTMTYDLLGRRWNARIAYHW